MLEEEACSLPVILQKLLRSQTAWWGWGHHRLCHGGRGTEVSCLGLWSLADWHLPVSVGPRC